MNKYAIRVLFYDGNPQTGTYLYDRNFKIKAKSKTEAVCFVENALQVLEYDNYKISDIKLIGKEI